MRRLNCSAGPKVIVSVPSLTVIGKSVIVRYVLAGVERFLKTVWPSTVTRSGPRA